MKEIIELKPGQYVSVMTPDGFRWAFTHEELVAALCTPPKGAKKKKTSPAIKFSHHVALACKALDTGKWPTGKSVDVNEVTNGLAGAFANLDASDYKEITPKAYETLLAHSEYKSIDTIAEIIYRCSR